MTRLIIGGVPRGQDYFGREQLIKKLWSRLENDHVLLVAPRRYGKTGAMYRLLDAPREPFRPLYLNVEYIESAANFMVELIAILIRNRYFSRIVSTLWDETKDFGRQLRNLPEHLDLGQLKIKLREHTDVPQHWLGYGERIMSLLSRDDPRLLLLLDEFPIMIEHIAKRDPEEARQFLRWFRTARTAPDTRSRFVIGGSINLISSLDKLGLVDTVNDLALERLTPFDGETAGHYIESVFASREIPLAPDVLESIHALVGKPIPYLLAVLLTAILDRSRNGEDTITPETVRAAFEEDVLGGGTSAVFQHYRSRIDQYYPGTEGTAALAVLGLLSRSEQPVSQDTLYSLFLKTANLPADLRNHDAFKGLMQRLENDFYIVRQDRSYAFHSRVLRLWWQTHYGYQGK